MQNETRYLNSGECCVIVEFVNDISPQINQKVRAMTRAIISANLEYITELVPTYRSLAVYYNPNKVVYKQLIDTLGAFETTLEQYIVSKATVTEIPVCYEADYAPDLEAIARHNKLSAQQVIEIHTEKPYLIYMLGFTPGFPYLGGMNSKIAMPRLDKPRLRVKEGSVGIANEQTGVLPIASPSGWRILGRTPIKLFQPDKSDPFLLKSGDYIRFKAISNSEFDALKSSQLVNRKLIDLGGDSQ